MSKHDELKEQAEDMARGKKTAELARLGFIYAYISNHELRIVFERLKTQNRLIWGLLIVIVLWFAKSVLVGT